MEGGDEAECVSEGRHKHRMSEWKQLLLCGECMLFLHTMFDLQVFFSLSLQDD